MRNFIQNELAQAGVAVVLLVVTGLLYVGMIHHERQLDEELKEAGINLEQLLK